MILDKYGNFVKMKFSAKNQPIDTKIEDMGEVIAGARKHLSKYLSKVKNNKSTTLPMLKPTDIRNMGFSNTIIDEKGKEKQVVDKKSMFILLLLREIHKRSRKANKKIIQFTFETILSAGKITDAIIDEVMKISKMDFNIEEVTKLSENEIKHLAKLYRVRDDGNIIEGKRYLYVDRNYISTWEKAIEYVRSIESAKQGEKKEVKKKAKLDIRYYTSPRDDGLYWLGVKISSTKFFPLKKFETYKDMKDYLKSMSSQELSDELRPILEEAKQRPTTRTTTNRDRVGKDHRVQQDVSPDAFYKTFPFRGVQFGTWVNQDERQMNLNRAFDALSDLGSVVGMSAKEITHDGKLSLAFGARGKGGKNAPMAHYEPYENVINLTKRNGAGTLAHEWFHSFDKELLRTINKAYGIGETDGYFTNVASGYKDGIALTNKGKIYLDEKVVEMAKIQSEINSKLRKMDFYKESQILDSATVKDYWTSTIEINARMFEVFTRYTLEKTNSHNDYLANIIDGASVYPTHKEIAELEPLVKKIFLLFAEWKKLDSTDISISAKQTENRVLKEELAQLQEKERLNNIDMVKIYRKELDEIQRTKTKEDFREKFFALKDKIKKEQGGESNEISSVLSMLAKSKRRLK